MNEHLQTVAVSDYLKKGLDILISNSSNLMALEALVQALEATLEGKQYDGSGVVLEAAVEAPIKPKHPLEDYKITEKDIGSLVVLSDRGGDSHLVETVLCEVGADLDYPYKDSRDFAWQRARPHLDPISLHFKPFYATADSKAPDDLGDIGYAVLWNDGDISVYDNTDEIDENAWHIVGDCEDEQYIIGYRPLSFVNPLLNGDE